jgi:type IV pilus assembly protein PilB
MPANFGAEHWDLSKVQFTPELLRLIPAELARKLRVMPILDFPGTLAVALADPSDLNAIDILTHTLNREIEICIADESQLDIYIQRYYGDDKATV